MNFWWTGATGNVSEDEMAKARGRTQRPSDERAISAYVERLAKAGTDRHVFDGVLAELEADKRLHVAEVVAIAHRYIGGGNKPASRKAAMGAITKRFVEIVRFHAKNKIAEKARPW